MCKELVSSILVIALLNFLSCTSTSTLTKIPDEYIQYEKEKGKPEEIFLITNDNERYRFNSWNYNINDNSFWGNGYLINGNEKSTLLRIPYTKIKLIQWEEYNEKATAVVAVLIVGAIILLLYVVLSGIKIQLKN